MEQTQTIVQHFPQNGQRCPGTRSACLHLHFGGFQIPVGKLAPQELVDLPSGFAKLVIIQQAVGRFGDVGQACQNPLVGGGVAEGVWLVGFAGIAQAVGDEAGGVPDFVGEVAVAGYFFQRQVEIVARRTAGQQGEAQSIRAVFLHHIQRIGHIALGFAHLLAVAIFHQSMQIDGVEGDVVGEKRRRHDHACHPEEEDVVARFHHVGGIEACQVGRLLGPAEGGERPQAGAEPGV